MTRLRIETEWQNLARGEEHERATFAALGIGLGDVHLTEAHDVVVDALRWKVHLSAYLLAEWMTANWWRLRWEPFRDKLDWSLSHNVASVGGGYVWPNLTISSDGQRSLLVCRPTMRKPAEPVRYLHAGTYTVQSSEFEGAVEEFVHRVLERMRIRDVARTNLHDLWDELKEERLDARASEYRKLEAILGFDPGDAPEALVASLLGEVHDLGGSAVEELAAADPDPEQVLQGDQIRSLAKQGIEIARGDAVHLSLEALGVLPRDVPAWRRGVAAAGALREQEGLGDAPISSPRLADLIGLPLAGMSAEYAESPISFELDQEAQRGVVVLKSRARNSRRFEVARLLGDRLAVAADGRLRPVTRSSTYRQKLQRAFAAELLCPFEALAEFVDDDFSEDRIEDAADYFGVSGQTVRMQLVNNGRADRDELDLERLSAPDRPLLNPAIAA